MNNVIRIMLVALAPVAAFGSVIDFEPQCPTNQPTGPCSSTFAAVGNAQTLMISTGIGTVQVQGGALLDGTTNLPADETAIYGTAGNDCFAPQNVCPSGTGFTNPLTITFPAAITNFQLDVLNGILGQSVTFQLADNDGHSAMFTLADNLSGGTKTIGFAATGTVVTVTSTNGPSGPSGTAWDFFIDNIHFDEPLTVPEPTNLGFLTSVGMAGLVLYRRYRPR